MPGVGKTTFCVQLCLNVQIPRYLQGQDGQSIYIGTDHSFSKFRLSQMAHAFVERCNNIISKSFTKRALINYEDVMTRIRVAQCSSLTEVIDLVISLESYLKENDDVRVVVIDSIAFPMFTEGEKFDSRVKRLYALGKEIYSLMFKYRVAFVITNCVTTRFGDGGKQSFVPYLGESFGYVPNQILRFECNAGDKIRKARLIKSPSNPIGMSNYRIINDGFRD